MQDVQTPLEFTSQPVLATGQSMHEASASFEHSASNAILHMDAFANGHVKSSAVLNLLRSGAGPDDRQFVQVLHDRAPSMSEYLPAGQSLQPPKLLLPLYIPTGQFAHVTSAVSLAGIFRYFPNGHVEMGAHTAFLPGTFHDGESMGGVFSYMLHSRNLVNC